MLLNKTTLSSLCLKTIESKINYHPKTRYNIEENENFYISGDFANYIQSFKERITVCKAIYVPDKYHVKRMIVDRMEPYLDTKAFDITTPTNIKRY